MRNLESLFRCSPPDRNGGERWVIASSARALKASILESRVDILLDVINDLYKKRLSGIGGTGVKVREFCQKNKNIKAQFKNSENGERIRLTAEILELFDQSINKRGFGNDQIEEQSEAIIEVIDPILMFLEQDRYNPNEHSRLYNGSIGTIVGKSITIATRAGFIDQYQIPPDLLPSAESSSSHSTY